MGTILVMNIFAGVMSVVLALSAYKIHQLSNVVVLQREDVHFGPMVNGKDIVYWVDEAYRLGYQDPCKIAEKE